MAKKKATKKKKGKPAGGANSKYISQAALARELDISKQRVGELVAEGRFPFRVVSGKKKLLAAECRESYANKRHYSKVDSTAPSDISINNERAAHERAKRMLAELELAKVEGSLIPADDIRELWQGQIIRAKSRLLSIPKRAAAILGLTGDQQAVINKLVKEALHELKEYKE